MNLEIIGAKVNELVVVVGQFIKGEVNKMSSDDVKLKGHHDFVTYVDKTSEERLVSGLNKILPVAGFIAEENPDLHVSDEYNWVIDPLDGTTNFIHAIPVFSISVALIKENEVIMGVVYEINNKELFYSWNEGKAYMNGSSIKVSATKRIDDSFIATGFPFQDYGRVDEYLMLLKHLMQQSHGLRRLGSAAIDLAYVACGRFDAFFEYGLKPWDVAAGSFIVKQAGGRVGDFSFSDHYIFNKEIVAANGYLFEDITRLVKKYFC